MKTELPPGGAGALLARTIEELRKLAETDGQPGYRGNQLHGGLLRGAQTLDDITDVSICLLPSVFEGLLSLCGAEHRALVDMVRASRTLCCRSISYQSATCRVHTRQWALCHDLAVIVFLAGVHK